MVVGDACIVVVPVNEVDIMTEEVVMKEVAVVPGAVDVTEVIIVDGSLLSVSTTVVVSNTTHCCDEGFDGSDPSLGFKFCTGAGSEDVDAAAGVAGVDMLKF
jgi:hypothetical protein